MTSWLLLDVELQFVNQYRVIHSKDYRPDVVTDDAPTTYYGMHFISAPEKTSPGDRVMAKIMLRAFPKDTCLLFQPGKKIFVKEGPLTKAEGMIAERVIHESPAKTILDLQKELFKNT